MIETIKYIFPIFQTSIHIALLSSFCTLVLASSLAYIMVNKRNKLIFETIITFPLIVPPTVLGFYLLLLLGNNSFLARYIGIKVIFTPQAAVIAATIASLPIMYRAIRNMLESIDEEIINSAMLDGANKIQILLFIKLPLSVKGIVSGLSLSFVRSIGEFGATLMVAGNIPGQTQTISTAIWQSVMGGDFKMAHSLAFVLLLVCLMVIVLGHAFESVDFRKAFAKVCKSSSKSAYSKIDIVVVVNAFMQNNNRKRYTNV